MDGQLTNVCIDKHERKQLPLTPPTLPRFFRHSNLKRSTQERYYIFVSFKLQKINIHEQKHYDSAVNKGFLVIR